MSDEELISAVTIASSSEKERNAVQFKNKKGIKVCEVNQGFSATVQADDRVDKLLSAVQQLTTQVGSLKNELDSLKHENRSSDRTVTKKGESKRCQNCIDQGANSCLHCFKCGSHDHFARGCRKGSSSKQQNQGNWN